MKFTFNKTLQSNSLIKQQNDIIQKRNDIIKKRNDIIKKHNEEVKERKYRDLYFHKNLYPITFSIPNSKVIDVNEIDKKTKIMSSLIPGVTSTYIYNNEAEYYNEYRKSIFATTIKKAGWDCLRHYEIIANGCIPYFPNIENCPLNTLALFPKKMIIEGNKLYEKYKNRNINELLNHEIEECNTLIHKLLDYTRVNLTTDKITEYILNKSNNETVEKILFLSGDVQPDYLRCLTLHGFKTKFGELCHDYPTITHLYKISNYNYSKLYGKGITYTNLLDKKLHNDDFDKTITEDIINKKYDLIIYCSYHRGTPFLGLVSKYYDPSKVIFLCGEDIGGCCHNSHIELLDKGFTVFVREL
jgi:hypothetical protein